jgi:predicted dithiol-disulfide oxidoreductase (DUF899 family)
MVRVDKDYVFDGTGGKASLPDLFEGRRQLIIYHFKFAPGVDGWPSAGRGVEALGSVWTFLDPLGRERPGLGRT